MFFEKFRMDGRVAVVTGGGRGIGLSCAEALAEAGATIVVIDREAGLAEEGRDTLRAKGYTVEARVADVTKTESTRAAADEIAATFGRIDVLVANAGIARSGTAAEDTPDELWLSVNDVNYNGVFWTNRDFGRHMLKAGRGAIVNIGSMSGYIVNRPQLQTYYNASKAAVHHLTASLAVEWASRGVRVNAVAPTYIDSAMTRAVIDEATLDVWLRDTPMGRMGQPDEIASVVHFLASDAASLITGATVKADAGFTCW
ncbi:SDR family NAD(P)-dependent oxidoreductase [Ensifer soli]|uniref:SDR family NAD(P)-dependent oxidoreductase n=1 Tax=Ciceribacter sp. sgz301302 TaxID=3342379 RepID=UPI0035BA9E44